MTAPALEVTQSHDPARLEALWPEWSALHDAAGAPSPFLAPEWLVPWWAAFGGRRLPWILEARDGRGALAGLLLLGGAPAPLGIRRWRLLGNGVTGADGLDALVRTIDAGTVRDALARAVAAAVGSWDLLDLEDLPCGSPTVDALRRAAAARGATSVVQRGEVCPGFALRGTFAEHLARIPRRETYGRRLRWFARQPGFAVDVATSAAEAGPALEDLLRLHRLRWAAEGGSQGIPPGPVEDFHRAAAPRLAARGWLRLYRLRVGGQAIAAVYGIEAGRRFSYYQSGYDPAWASRSPGLVLVGRTVEDAYARGLTDYDFLRGTEPYKLEWASDRRETQHVRIHAPSLRAGTAVLARDAWRGARGAVRAVAPRAAWEALRRVRRELENRALTPAHHGAGEEARARNTAAPRSGAGEGGAWPIDPT
jgi:CelD/BcsL family acetyltransferase involved in cellulose biosynthesis